MSTVATIVAALALGILGGALGAEAQPPAKVPRIGILRTSPEPPAWGFFYHALRELGYVEGRTITIERRQAKGSEDRVVALAAELVRLNVDIIVSGETRAILAAKQTTSTIPILMVGTGDPVGTGLVASLARPGGNVTGVTRTAPDLSDKRLELLKETVPRLSRVAVLSNPGNPTNALQLRETHVAANVLGVQIQVLEVRAGKDLEAVFQAVIRGRAGAVMPLSDPLLSSERRRIVDFAAKSRLPAMYDRAAYVEAGGLMAYGVSDAEIYRRGAAYVDKILKGAKPADLPVEQPMRFELVINLKTAKALGFNIPQSVLFRADQVIR